MYYDYATNTFTIPDYDSFGYVQLAQSINAFDAPITYLADLFKNGIIYSVDEKGNVVENDELVYRLNSPNRFQGKEEFLSQFYYFLTAAGYNYILPYSKSLGFENRLKDNELYNLNPDYVNFKKIKKDIFDLGDLDFDYVHSNKDEKFERPFNTKGVIPFYDIIPDIKNPYKGVSRLSALINEARNTVLADKGKTNQIKKSGAVIVSAKERSNGELSEGLDEEMMSSEPNREGKRTTHKQDIQNKLNAAGLASGESIIVSSKELVAQTLSKDIQGIDFDKLKSMDLLVCSNKIGVPPELNPFSSKNATYENREQAQFSVLQNRIEPVANSLAKSLQLYFESKNRLVIDYSHLPAYQVAQKVKEEIKDKVVDRYEKLFKDGIITAEQFVQILVKYDILNEER